jgi:hypothetical protein
MSGNSRALSSADGSIFFASQWAAALSSTTPNAVRNWTKIGTEILYIDTVMAEALVGWRASLRHCVGMAARGDKRSPPKPVRLLIEKDNRPGCSQRRGAFDVRL